MKNTTANLVENIIFNAAKRINQEENSSKREADELFLIEKLHLLNTPDKMMRIIRLCDWTLGHNVIKAILIYIDWRELSTRKAVQLVKRSGANPDVLKDFIIFSDKTLDNEIIECINYAVKIDFFCYPDSNRIYPSYENIFSELAKKNLLSHKLIMHLFSSFEDWGVDFLKYSINIIKWKNLSNRECLAIFNKYRRLANNPNSEISSLYDEAIKKLSDKQLNDEQLYHLYF